MSYAITNRCIQCDNCLPECPKDAIHRLENGEYWIDPILCDDCCGLDQPVCLSVCAVASPVPLQAKKGRCKVEGRVATSPDLFPDGKNHPFASAIVVWEACNILAQRQSINWTLDEAGKLFYQRSIRGGQGLLTFRLKDTLTSDSPTFFPKEVMTSVIQSFDIRAACIHLLYAAYATGLDKPWEQEFVISDRQIEEYLGLDKRKDLSKLAKLTLIRELVLQPTKLAVNIDWPQQGMVPGFTLIGDRLWHLSDMQYQFQDDEQGCKHLIGLTFRVRAGQWAKYFLNRKACKERSAYYQYGTLPKSLLSNVMSIWQQHEGAARMMLWLLFKTKMGVEQRISVPTLMRIAYGENRVNQANVDREQRKYLVRAFESDLEALHHYRLKPVFDEITYPAEIQPLWVKLLQLPEDAEDALDFWISDGSNAVRLTDAAPRGKWNRLLNARILSFELPVDWRAHTTKKSERKQSRNYPRQTQHSPSISLSGEDITAARKRLQLSQRTLAEKTGKSQSWIRDIEKGRFQPKEEDQRLLRKALELDDPMVVNY
jgi:DNA-binding transcriptional regulator YiaG/Pyruvate/2-oxoacid:ferredoxin oxidoreductase delta subunit